MSASTPPHVGEAGRSGEDVRSDLFVRIEHRDSGGVDIEIVSKVAAFYSASIRQSVESVLGAYEVSSARVEVVDKGALPYVIEARVETALRRADISGTYRPEARIAPGDPTARDHLRRSRLYLPGNEPKFAINAGIHKADGVILDLEDSVHPDEKDAARILVRNTLAAVDFMGAERMVRINQVPLGYDDLEEVVPQAPDLILIPKVENREDVCDVDERIREIQKRSGVKRSVWLMPIIESALGVENAFEIAKATDAVVALTIGLEDFTADLGVQKTKQGDESVYARMRLVNAARAAGIQAIDSVYGDVGDVEGLESWGRRSRAMGFEGMGCIHPRQIRAIHRAFAPSPAEIEKAARVVAAFEDAQARGLGVVSLGTRMIDPPVVKRAQRIVAAAKRAGLYPEGAS